MKLSNIAKRKNEEHFSPHAKKKLAITRFETYSETDSLHKSIQTFASTEVAYCIACTIHFVYLIEERISESMIRNNIYIKYHTKGVVGIIRYTMSSLFCTKK